MLERVVTKLTSARWLMALAITGTFCTLALTGKLEASTITGVVGVVIGYYFNRATTESTNAAGATAEKVEE